MERGYWVYLGTCMMIQDCLFNISHYNQYIFQVLSTLHFQDTVFLFVGLFLCFCCCSVFKTCLTLPTHGLHHVRLICPPLSPRLCSNSWHLSVTLSEPLIFCCPFLLLPSIFPRIRVFSKELDVWIRWPKYWSFSLSNRLSCEYSGFISFRIDWFDLLGVQGTLKSLLQHHNSKASILQHSLFFMVQLLHPYMTTGKTKALSMKIFVEKWCHWFLICFPPKEKAMATHSSILAWRIPWTRLDKRNLVCCSPWGHKELDTTEWCHFHALEKAMATHSSALAWRIPGMVEPGGLLSVGSHRVRHDWSDLAAAAAASQGASVFILCLQLPSSDFKERKSVTASFSSSICHEGTGCHDLIFLMLSFKSAFSLSFFTFIKRLFSFSLPLEWYTSAYLRLLIFLLAISILACRLIKSIISHNVLCI